MQTDDFGRPFLDGSEDGPNDLRCLKCGNIPYLQGNPFGTCIFEFSRGDAPDLHSAFALCDPCVLEFWEWTSPMLTTHPGYIAKKDQHAAAIPDFKREWNRRAPDDEQVPE